MLHISVAAICYVQNEVGITFRHSNSPEFSGSLPEINAISGSPNFYQILPIFEKNIHRSRRWEGNLNLLYKPSISVYDFIRTPLNPARSLANTDPNPEDLAEGPREKVK
jgi:hypothetical protein